MTVQKPTPTALTRILTLLIATGALAGCDYASKLPDAPETLGYELQQRKPPSVTGIDSLSGTGPLAEAPRIAPKPVDTQELHSVPLPPAPVVAPSAPAIQVTDIPQYQPDVMPQPAYQVPPPEFGVDPELQQVFADTALPRGGSVGTPDEVFSPTRFDPPQLGVASEYADSYSAPAPVAFDNVQSREVYQTGGYQVEVIETGPSNMQGMYENIGSVDSITSGATSVSGGDLLYAQPDSLYSQPGSSFDPGGSYVTAAAPLSTVPQSSAPDYAVPPLATPLPFESTAPIYRGVGAQGGAVNASPIQVIRTRLSNGALVNVHPVIGVPSGVSRSLANTIATEIGAPVGSGETINAPAIFDLRAQAPGGGTAEWKLYNASRNVIGVFSENAPAIGWRNAGQDEISAVGRRIADRLRRNADLRRSTLNSIASSPVSAPSRSVQRQPGMVPYPIRNPRRVGSAIAQAPLGTLEQPALRPRPAPVSSMPLAPLAPLAQLQPAPAPRIATQVPRLRPAPPARVAPAPVALPQMAALQPAQPALNPVTIQPQPVAISAPSVQTAPPPSFETLRAKPSEPIGPRVLVFRGVKGAPGDGDQALAREMSRVLAQSPAKLAPGGTPGAIYLAAEVSTQRGGSADRVKITWQVQDADGNKVGQVVQENDVPRGALDGGWGEDAYFATQGAKQGIMELLQEAGALG